MLAVLWTVCASPCARAGAGEPPAQVHELLKLLADPQVADWIRHSERAAPPDTAPDAPGIDRGPFSLTAAISQRLKFIREYTGALAATIPRMSVEFARAQSLFEQEFEVGGRVALLLLLGAFVALGLSVEWLFERATRPMLRARGDPAFDQVGDRVRAVAVRFLVGLATIASYAVGSVGVFLAVDWPDSLREIVLTYLLASLAIRMATVTGRFLLSPPSRAAPAAARFRLVPLTDRGARFWYRSAVLAVAWMTLGSATIHLLGTFSFSDISREVLYDGLLLGLAMMSIVAVWRAPVSFYEPSRFIQRWGRRSILTFATCFFLGLWLLRLTAFHGPFALLLVTFALPTLVAVAQRAVNHILRPPGAEHDDAKLQSVQAVVLERGVRALLIAGAAYLLGLAWGLDLASLTMVDTLFTRIVRDVLNAVVIVLVADLLWHVTSVAIDNRLREVGAGGDGDIERHARQRTLLPILRNVLFVTIAIVTGMMVLAGMGIAVGPLIASAGVLGVAVGFGSQTLVRDIISGIFYLFDDAFRVGEYIQSGSYKGTVEAFSLRSVKLRHHRGPLYTIPFGALGAIQNMSRDWTIEKVTIGVAYDTDVAQVKSLIRQIGKQLQDDPELAPSILETLKLQGIQSFGDYGMQLRVKIMTKAGEQFVVRRRALALIKMTFDANGISFALPTVQVNEHPGAAAAVTVGLGRATAGRWRTGDGPRTGSERGPMSFRAEDVADLPRLRHEPGFAGDR